MTKEEAYKAMLDGKAVTHKLFSPDEFLYMDELLIIRDEQDDEFENSWDVKNGDEWSTDWYICKSKRSQNKLKESKLRAAAIALDRNIEADYNENDSALQSVIKDIEDNRKRASTISVEAIVQAALPDNSDMPKLEEIHTVDIMLNKETNDKECKVYESTESLLDKYIQKEKFFNKLVFVSVGFFAIFLAIAPILIYIDSPESFVLIDILFVILSIVSIGIGCIISSICANAISEIIAMDIDDLSDLKKSIYKKGKAR